MKKLNIIYITLLVGIILVILGSIKNNRSFALVYALSSGQKDFATHALLVVIGTDQPFLTFDYYTVEQIQYNGVDCFKGDRKAEQNYKNFSKKDVNYKKGIVIRRNFFGKAYKKFSVLCFEAKLI